MQMKVKKFKSSFTRAQSLIEFALVLPLLILLIVGSFEFGILFMTYHTVQNAGREGARLAVVLPNLVDNDTRVIDRVEGLIPDTGVYSSFENGITNNGISDCLVNDQVTVTITGTYNFIFLKMIGIDTINITIPTTMRYEGC
jgi:Flp pilus assembly protein TadG